MSKRTEKGSNKKWVDRIDVISAHAGSKHVSQTSFPVNTFEDVITSISLFSEQLHECLGTRLDDVLGESLNIKSLRGIDSFMYPL